MRLKVLLGLAIICLAVWSSSSVATGYKCYSAPDTCQVCWDTTKTPAELKVLDWGVCDTVRIGCPVGVGDLVDGDSFQVPIYLYNDAKIGGFTFPFRHYGRNLSFGFGGDYGLDFTGATVLTSPQQRAWLLFTRDTLQTGWPKTDTGSVLLGWADMTGLKPIAANTTGAAKLLGSFYLVLTGTTTHQVVRFDTAYYTPGGEWVATTSGVPNAPELHPKFVPPCDIALPVQEVKTSSLPQKFELGQNMPNPFNPNTVIVFSVPRPSEVRVEVFNVLGQKVKTLANEFLKAGYKRVEWDGTNDNGNSVASGVYLYRLTAGDFSETKKMLLLK